MGDADGSSKKTYSRPGFKFETGFRIELLETSIWYTCKILQVDWEKELILIHYDRWSHKFDEWVPMSSPDIRPCKDKGRQRQDSKKHFRVREDVFALWSDGRRYPGSVQAVLPNDQYQVMFFDGFMKKLRSKQLSKWTRENEQRFGTAGPGGSGLQALPSVVAAGTVGIGAAPAPAATGFVPEVLETKRKRKTNPIVEELLGPKRARRQLREESEIRHRSPSGAPSTGSAASTPGGGSRKQSWAMGSRDDADADSAETGSEWDDSLPEEEEEEVEDEEELDMELDDMGDDEDEEESAENDSVYSESALSFDDTASSSCRSTSPAAPTPSPAPAPTPAPAPAPADPTAAQDLPPGWRRILTQRLQANRLDVTLYSPDGVRFRSRAELERFVARTGATHLDPAIMFRRPPRDRGAVGRPSTSRRQSSASSPPGPPPPAPPRAVSRPSFASSSGSLSHPAGSSEGGGGRPSFTSTPSYPGTGPTPGGRGVYVGTEGLQKKLPLGWALEPIVDKPAEPEQRDFPCLDCNKRFRKESFMQMHIKHYHPELRHLVNARSASVVRQAETRSMQSLLTPTGESTVETPGRTTGRLRSAGESILSSGGGRERGRGSSGERAWVPESAPSPPRPPPPPPPAVAESPRAAAGAAVKPPTDDPKLLAEPVVSVRSDMRQLTAVHGHGLSSSDGKHSPAASARSFRRPRRRQPTAEDTRGELNSDFIQIVDQESPQKTGRRAVGRPPRRQTEPSEASERGDNSRLHSFASVEDAASPSSPAPSSTSVRDTDAAPEDDLASESGTTDKLEHHEVIRCTCGVQEEDGLMIQCELCLAWQHGVCLGIASDAEVPSRYVCATCRHPWRVRQTQRYVWEQQLFRDGALLRLPFGGEEAALERAQAVMRAACDLTANALSLQAVIRSLRLKLAIASDINHPKLYLWARPWSPPPGQGERQAEAAVAASHQSQTAAEASDRSAPATAAVAAPLVPSVEGQSERASVAADQSASLLAAALESPALLAAVNSAAAELTASPAGLVSQVTPPTEFGPGHVTAAAAVPNGTLAPTGAASGSGTETDPLANLSSDQTALLTASLAAAGTPLAADGAPAAGGDAVKSPAVSDTAPTGGVGAGPPTGTASTDAQPPAVEGVEAPAVAAAGTKTESKAVAESMETPAAAAAAPTAGENTEPLEETDDPLSGVLDAIVGLLPSQSDLDQLMDGPVTEATSAPPAAPVSEARIDPATCQVNLLQHVTQMQTTLMSRLDIIEQHVEALEKVSDLEPDWGGERPDVCRSLLRSVLRDVGLMERLGRLS